MILVDTSVWVDHLRTGDASLAELLEAGRVVVHPFVLGELALANLRHRDVVLAALQDLPRSAVASAEEVLHFIERSGVFGQGIGYVDAHLLAAVRLSPETSLWTRDKRLLAVAERLGAAAARLR